MCLRKPRYRDFGSVATSATGSSDVLDSSVQEESVLEQSAAGADPCQVSDDAVPVSGSPTPGPALAHAAADASQLSSDANDGGSATAALQPPEE